MIRSVFKRSLGVIMPVFAVLALLVISYLRLLDNYELGSLDLRFVLRYPKIPTTERIAFIEIGEDTIAKLGRFPFDRKYHAMIVKALAESKAEMILFDFLFSEPHEDDAQLEFALNQAGNVYLPSAFDIGKKKGEKVLSADGYVAKCLEDLLREAKGTGHINIVPDQDGKYRRIPIFVNYEDTYYPYISFAMGLDHLGMTLKDIKLVAGKYAAFGKSANIPLDDNSNMIVNFSGKWGASYKHYSYVDVLQSYIAKQSGQKPALDLNALKDKICIIGLTATGAGDVHPNPFEPISPGMGVHAEVINAMINKNFITRASRAVNLYILITLSIFISLLTFKTKPVTGLYVLLLEMIFFVAVAVFLFNFFGIWIDMAYPILAMVLLYLILTVYKYVAEWKSRIVFESELGIAKKIQESFLPKKMPEAQGVEIACAMATARQVGGDLYDFVSLGADRFGIMIGDVSGKGIPASLFMAMVTGSFKFFSKREPMPKEVLLNLNNKLVEESSSNLFVTMFYAIFDMNEKSLAYSNGGHLPLLYLNKAGDVRFLDVSEGTPLGVMEGPYAENKINFAEGDVFIFYTDGITEAMDSRSELYGEERLKNLAISKKELSPTEMLKAIIHDVQKFEPKSEQHDDMTVIVVKIQKT